MVPADSGGSAAHGLYLGPKSQGHQAIGTRYGIGMDVDRNKVQRIRAGYARALGSCKHFICV
jgi:hypothetical protein